MIMGIEQSRACTCIADSMASLLYVPTTCCRPASQSASRRANQPPEPQATPRIATNLPPTLRLAFPSLLPSFRPHDQRLLSIRFPSFMTCTRPLGYRASSIAIGQEVVVPLALLMMVGLLAGRAGSELNRRLTVRRQANRLDAGRGH